MPLLELLLSAEMDELSAYTRHAPLSRAAEEANWFTLPSAVRTYRQFLQLDTDHDGMLSLAEFVAGLKANNREGMRLHTPQMGISSRAYFRTIPFNHPFHNVMHNAPQHFFRGPDADGEVMQPGTAWNSRM